MIKRNLEIGFHFRIIAVEATLLLVALLLLPSAALGQKDDLPDGVVPPPLSVLSEKEADLLEEESSAKKRTKLAIELMDNRLLKSESSSKAKEFQNSLNQLGHFRALMLATLVDLKRSEINRKALRNNKRFEIALRSFIPRLELVRRALPFSHSYHVTILIKDVRKARTETIEPFFDDTVLPNGVR